MTTESFSNSTINAFPDASSQQSIIEASITIPETAAVDNPNYMEQKINITIDTSNNTLTIPAFIAHIQGYMFKTLKATTFTFNELNNKTAPLFVYLSANVTKKTYKTNSCVYELSGETDENGDFKGLELNVSSTAPSSEYDLLLGVLLFVTNVYDNNNVQISNSSNKWYFVEKMNTSKYSANHVKVGDKSFEEYLTTIDNDVSEDNGGFVLDDGNISDWELPEKDYNFYFTSAKAFTISMDLSKANSSGVMEYSTNGITWNTYTSNAAIRNEGNKYTLFRGTGFTSFRMGTTSVTSSIFTIQGDSTVKVGGNILKLLNYSNVDNINMGTYCFSGLFYNQTMLDITDDFCLPATTLADACYFAMFHRCHSLTKAPALPATTLANKCYYNMFYNCSSLTKAPALPATTLVSECYRTMFYSCARLKIPAIIGDGTTAVTLDGYASEAMAYMYSQCTSLHIYTSDQGESIGFFKGISSTNNMTGMFLKCYIDGVQQQTGNGISDQQYYY